MSDDGLGLAAAAGDDQAAGADRGEGGSADGPAGRAGAPNQGLISAEAYQREWAAKGHSQVYVPEGLRMTVPGPYRPAPLRAIHRTMSADEELVFEDNVDEVFAELEELLLSKHADYGPTNIAHAPGGALNGLRVRIHDKVARINHLLATERDPRHEALEDSFRDLANYAVIALLVLRRQWPGQR